MASPLHATALDLDRGTRLPSLTKYEVIEEIGHGGMATVYRARDPRLAREVAIKVIHPHLRDSAEVSHRFHVEAQAVAKLRHRNIVEVFDVSDEADREQYLVAELVRGKTLRKVLQEQSSLPPEVAAALGLELLAALDHAHGEGVVHRDIKPENVLIAVTNDEVQIKLTDFGIAKLLDAKGVTSTGQVLGSPAHMAPEQIEGGEVDARSDVFGMGVLLYECMVGHLPFEGHNPAQVLRRVLDGEYAPAELECPTIGKKWSAILDQALSREASGRFPSALAMRDAIAKELTRLEVTDAAAEIKTFLEDTEAYADWREPLLIDRLCTLGASARATGNAIDAAHDYNRALAYAPDDPALLKVVSTIHRASARLEFVKQTGPIFAALCAAALVAFFVTRAIKGQANHGDRSIVSPPTSSARVAVASSPSSSARPLIASSVIASPSSPALRPQPFAPAPLPSLRKITFANVKPMAGVTVTIDQGPATNISTGSTLEVDTRSHVLHFGCVVKDICEPIARTLGESKADEVITMIELKVKPAILVVFGEPSGSYGIDDFPSIDVTSGIPVNVPVRGYSGNWVTVIDRNAPTRSKKVNLTAGQESRVTFSEP